MHLERLHHVLEHLLEVHLEVVEQLHDGEGIDRLVQQAGLLVLVLPEGVLVSQHAEVAGFLGLKASSLERSSWGQKSCHQSQLSIGNYCLSCLASGLAMLALHLL